MRDVVGKRHIGGPIQTAPRRTVPQIYVEALKLDTLVPTSYYSPNPKCLGVIRVYLETAYRAGITP